MSFNSINYIIFLSLTLLIFYLVKNKYRKYVLLIASIIFYLLFSIKYLVLLIGLILITYYLSKLLNNDNKKRILIIYLILFLGILAFYKYYNLLPINTDNIIFPLGISFYIFQMIGYFIDVYRNNIEVSNNLFDFMLLVMYFPKIASGPIEDSNSLLKQIRNIDKADNNQIIDGFLLILIGTFKKLMIANRIGSIIDPIINSYEDYSGLSILICLLLYAFQIYTDFSGYSDMAVGSSKLFGIELINNFRHPYLCENFDDFWKRWHISLTNWFRNYVYFPLGGSRKGKIRTYINILIIFILSGIWHGSQFHYFIWGLVNGILVIISKLISKQLNINKVIRRVLSLLMIVICWTFFRMDTSIDAIKILMQLFNMSGKSIKYTLDLFVAISLCILLILLEVLSDSKDIFINFKNKPFYYRSVVYLVLIFIVILFGYYGKMASSSFIYFKY